MQAPLSKRARRILEDRNLAKQLMEALLLGSSDDPNNPKHTITLDGKVLRVVRVSEPNK
jgi:hypothetical protein